jgi:putative PIN family toxin of toxin-antitoxin system
VRSNPRCVFDTNVLVSALLFDQSQPAQAFFAALHAGEVLVSADVIVELNDVLGREKFARYVNEEERARFLQSLLREARLVETKEKVRACRDPNYDKFLELAVNGGADCIVSGDKDLLSLDPFRGIPILTPDRFLDALSKDRPEEK